MAEVRSFAEGLRAENPLSEVAGGFGDECPIYPSCSPMDGDSADLAVVVAIV